MEEPIRIQLAWKVIELLEILADLVLEYYIDDPFAPDYREDLSSDEICTS